MNISYIFLFISTIVLFLLSRSSANRKESKAVENRNDLIENNVQVVCNTAENATLPVDKCQDFSVYTNIYEEPILLMFADINFPTYYFCRFFSVYIQKDVSRDIFPMNYVKLLVSMAENLNSECDASEDLNLPELMLKKILNTPFPDEKNNGTDSSGEKEKKWSLNERFKEYEKFLCVCKAYDYYVFPSLMLSVNEKEKPVMQIFLNYEGPLKKVSKESINKKPEYWNVTLVDLAYKNNASVNNENLVSQDSYHKDVNISNRTKRSVPHKKFERLQDYLLRKGKSNLASSAKFKYE